MRCERRPARIDDSGVCVILSADRPLWERPAASAQASGDIEIATRMLVEALEPAGGVIECDRSVEIACLPMLGELALERLDAAAWQVVVRQRSRFDRQERGAEDTSFRLALSAAAYACDMDGDFDRAAAEARLAEELASTPPARALALCSRAMVARLAGGAVSHRDHVCAALALLESCKERDGFPAFATLPLDVANE